ncbi:Na(+)/H(+) antiporter [Niallia circulans]|jgi:monovalent cation:H+ antiporter-2, CPA2 family|uniref:Sodium:proton antiporter n=1 Tax=Niallia circulans TaxID=1397 RepID=A0A0J1IJL4_NIACI|nr:monovalent cation:proton antiporter family protein [Niallia circulans]KLV26146.1 sodium:proton antiporter [Niallia circulans]MCM2982614.1 monovalent cation:proton antiporter family protein [Niallia circulans]MDR4316109.1 sodium:proton antiporter [Niallia circulans]MED3837552.1 monovalent cation:proton antiporter family protein [Niallia circulans]MED4244622.1 monovalent cation:proton antiporter family protein [Niallia circulans]
MAHGASFASLVIVVTVALLTPIILQRLKLNVIPVVVAEILMGLIIGKSGFNLVEQDMWLETLSTLGFIFLMFLSGLEIDFSAFSSKKKRETLPNGELEPKSFQTAIIIFAAILVLSIGLSFLFVFAGFVDSTFLMTIIIATISLGVVVPTLKEANIMKSVIGQIILLVAVIADLVTMILLAVFASIHESGGNTWLLLILFGAGLILYFVGRRIKNKKFMDTLSRGTVQIGTRAVFALIIFLVALSESVGAEHILGAFLAGVLVSLLSPNEELVHQLDSFGYGFLIPIFFVMIGVEMDIWSLFTDLKLLLFIPLLLVALLVSKLLPIYYLKKWYDTKTIVASGFLLTSTLSLVIAAATIGERLNIITTQMSGTFILVAIISCIITPVVFKKLFPKEAAREKVINVSIIGVNQVTMQVYQELKSTLYDVTFYHKKQEKHDFQIADSLFEIIELENYSEDILQQTDIYGADIVVVSTGDSYLNAEMSLMIKRAGVDRVICRVENMEKEEVLRREDIEVFSMLTSTKALLTALIQSPNIFALLGNTETALHEITLRNKEFEGMSLRSFPFTGDVIFVRIFRGSDFVIPHGDTELQLNDHLLVTGSHSYVTELKRQLEFNYK